MSKKPYYREKKYLKNRKLYNPPRFVDILQYLGKDQITKWDTHFKTKKFTNRVT